MIFNCSLHGACNFLCFAVNFVQIVLHQKIQKRLIFIHNNYVAAARLLGCSYSYTLKNTNSAKNISAS